MRMGTGAAQLVKPPCPGTTEAGEGGVATKMDCIHMMKEQLRVMAQHMVDLAKTTRE